MTAADLALCICLFFGAILYSSVGHAGASAYIALMALFGVPPAVMRPTALVLNLFVGTIGSFRYWKAGLFRWRTLWPFLIGSIPFAFLGGAIKISGDFYRPLVAFVLFLSAVRLLWPRDLKAVHEWHDPSVPVAIASGAGIGLLAGLTGTGGGIFLSPLLILMAWSAPKPASGVTAMFILCNSIFGLMGNIASLKSLPPNLPYYIAAVVAGGLIGTTLGIRFTNPWVARALGVVLLVASAKLVGVY
nr:sulfite exporter TauE/SafE family protein [uncultured Sphingomonas sp.]